MCKNDLQSQDLCRLVPEIEAILDGADKALISEMADVRSTGGGERLCSVSSKYLSNLTNLLDTLKLDLLSYYLILFETQGCECCLLVFLFSVLVGLFVGWGIEVVSHDVAVVVL